MIKKNKKFKFNNDLKFLLMLFVGILLIAFVYSDTAVITRTTGSNITYMEDDTDALINITINVTTAGLNSNITAVVINISQLEGKANFTVGSESQINTSIANNTNTKFQNLNYTLNWTNIKHTTAIGSPLINDTKGSNLRYFWFNLSALAPVKYGNISVLLMTNGSLTSVQQNLTLHINDTFNVNFVGSTPVNYANISKNYIYAAINISGNETGVSVNVTLSNSTGGGKVLRSNTTASTGVYGLSNASGFIFNYSNLVDGTYYLNVTVNSTPTLDRNESLTRRIIIDRTAPTISLSKSSASGKTWLTIDVAITDATSGIGTACTVDNTDTIEVIGVTTSQTVNDTSLTCGTSYTYIVTCTDHAGNVGSSASTSLSTDACSSTGSGGGGGGSSGTTWTMTYTVNDEQFSSGYSKQLGTNNRFKIEVNNQEHTVGVKEISGSTAKILVQSTPQEATLSVGQEKKFDVTDDGYYDVLVKLVNIVGSKAEISVKSVYEKVVTPTTPSTPGEAGQGAQASPPSVSGGSNMAWLWIILAIIVVALVVFFIVKKKK